MYLNPIVLLVPLSQFYFVLPPASSRLRLVETTSGDVSAAILDRICRISSHFLPQRNGYVSPERNAEMMNGLNFCGNVKFLLKCMPYSTFIMKISIYCCLCRVSSATGLLSFGGCRSSISLPACHPRAPSSIVQCAKIGLSGAWQKNPNEKTSVHELRP